MVIPWGVRRIETGVFANRRDITSVELPETLIEIHNSRLEVIYPGSGAFSGCSSLTNITIPQSVRYVGVNAFSGCSSLKNVTFIEDFETDQCLAEIGYDAFKDCLNLTIHAPAGGDPEKYARAYKIPFVEESGWTTDDGVNYYTKG